MLNNIVFDLGNVLLNFKPKEYLKTITDDSQLREKLYENIFNTEYWLELDRGTLTRKQALNKMIARYPAQKDKIIYIMNNWISMLTRKKETISVLEKLYYSNKYNLYVLSNFHTYAYQEVKRKYDFFQFFDGIVISAEVKSIKPEREVYEYLLNNYDLQPEATVFIDDTEENIKGAEKLSMKTIHYQGDEALKKLNKL